MYIGSRNTRPSLPHVSPAERSHQLPNSTITINALNARGPLISARRVNVIRRDVGADLSNPFYSNTRIFVVFPRQHSDDPPQTSGSAASWQTIIARPGGAGAVLRRSDLAVRSSDVCCTGQLTFERRRDLS
jgi:hypothetical protein